ncbi:hypothetical protein [Propionivibrio soli]|uniref:hypothetical protein n=1 Tax=Propionivibrio soli TaxID=2976531 RepID=UPI0021E8ECCA|nr:hypothetical protein [Propionivibrio soli]
MQTLLSYDQSPPLAAPFRFFLTAPVFGILGGVLILCYPEVFASRWTPATLALTHLITVGFMLQVMLGALIQILPVVAGANIGSPLRVAGLVHAAISVGTVFLVAAFFSYSPAAFKVAALLFTVGIACFIVSALRAFSGVPTTSPTVGGLKLSLAGLTVTAALGVGLTAALGWSLDWPLMQLADIHLGWGFVAWGTVLLAAVAYVVVPMFQITRPYPRVFERFFAVATIGALAVWSISEWVDAGAISLVLALVVVLAVACFAGVTLKVQRTSKRSRFDATQHLWRAAMLSALAACAVWGAGRFVPTVAERAEWPVLFGALVLAGGFMSVIVGMLYKIVPFLVWLHLQNLGQGRVVAPNMKKIISEAAMERQSAAHVLACVLVALAALWPATFAYPAGASLVVANAWLLWNLTAAVRLYRSQVSHIESLRA